MDTALAIYMSLVANRQNETMKTLAVVATIFMPLTLVAGIYGMNFSNIPELAWGWAYYGVLVMMGAFFLGAVWLTWLRGRLGLSGRHGRQDQRPFPISNRQAKGEGSLVVPGTIMAVGPHFRYHLRRDRGRLRAPTGRRRDYALDSAGHII